MTQPPNQVLEYLASQRVGVLAVEMLDGSPHAATVPLPTPLNHSGSTTKRTANVA